MEFAAAWEAYSPIKDMEHKTTNLLDDGNRSFRLPMNLK